MKYLGIVKPENGKLTIPDSFVEVAQSQSYEAIQVGTDILLVPSPLDRERLKRIEKLASRSIDEHRRTLEGLAR
jgi:hypothetical protein